ncbi:Hypothetical protein SRAE_X000084000 [Strongyloides ratti]|uniref:Uncharacterized protein n=1 Tax=Strongyloides ratti TaxID=34506 RepID=A0A090LP30_STRRB|nr:Hypothetical protein SRAE_X000084000 [Strongyloides ratti]CEF71516.1 Hypothetical protein SRAE_X000084000 [Strongyloides ratti]
MKNIIKLTIFFFLITPSTTSENQDDLYLNYNNNVNGNNMMPNLHDEITPQQSFLKEKVLFDMLDSLIYMAPKNKVIKRNNNDVETQFEIINNLNNKNDFIKKNSSPSRYIGLGKRSLSEKNEIKREYLTRKSADFENKSFANNNFRLIGLGKRSLKDKYSRNLQNEAFPDYYNTKRNNNVRFIGLGKRSLGNIKKNTVNLEGEFTDFNSKKIKRRNPFVFRIIPFIYRRESKNYYPMMSIGKKGSNQHLEMKVYENNVRGRKNFLHNIKNDVFISNKNIDNGNILP